MYADGRASGCLSAGVSQFEYQESTTATHADKQAVRPTGQRCGKRELLHGKQPAPCQL